MDEKFSPNQYAVLLYETTKGLAHSEIKARIENFVKLLRKNNNLGMSDKILEDFESYYKFSQGIREVELISAKPLSRENKEKLIDSLGKHSKIELREKIVPSLLGGFMIKMGDTMIDGTIKRKLADLNNKLRK